MTGSVSEPTPSPAPSAPAIDLYDDHQLPWQPVSRRLITVRSISIAIPMVILLAITTGLALVLHPLIAAIAGPLIVVLWIWAQWLIFRQVPAISYAELDDEVAIRRGRLWRRLVTIPYGRIQYVDLQAGPLLRAFGLASIEVHTASPSSSGAIPGLPEATAHALRERLAARGEAERAGL